MDKKEKKGGKDKGDKKAKKDKKDGKDKDKKSKKEKKRRDNDDLSDEFENPAAKLPVEETQAWLGSAHEVFRLILAVQASKTKDKDMEDSHFIRSPVALECIKRCDKPLPVIGPEAECSTPLQLDRKSCSGTWRTRRLGEGPEIASCVTQPRSRTPQAMWAETCSGQTWNDRRLKVDRRCPCARRIRMPLCR